MIYVDTSAFYAYLSRDDQDHRVTVDAFRACLESESPLTASSYVLVETMGLVQHRLGVRVLTRFVDDMLPMVRIQWMGPAEHEAAWKLVGEVGKRAFTIVDASTAALMERDRVRQVLALDPEFRRLGFEALPVVSGTPLPGARRSSRR